MKLCSSIAAKGSAPARYTVTVHRQIILIGGIYTNMQSFETEPPLLLTESPPTVDEQPDREAFIVPTPTVGINYQFESSLGEIKSRNEEQLSLQRASHKLMVDLSKRVQDATDETSSRERKSILLELIMLHDSFEKALIWIRDSNEPRPIGVIVERLEDLRVELFEILLRREVRVYDESLYALNRRLHQTIKTLPTPDPALNNVVAATVRRGYYWREQVLRPEEVVIYKHVPEVSKEKA
jgi:molecular chaperone GrpE